MPERGREGDEHPCRGRGAHGLRGSVGESGHVPGAMSLLVWTTTDVSFLVSASSRGPKICFSKASATGSPVTFSTTLPSSIVFVLE